MPPRGTGGEGGPMLHAAEGGRRPCRRFLPVLFHSMLLFMFATLVPNMTSLRLALSSAKPRLLSRPFASNSIVDSPPS